MDPSDASVNPDDAPALPSAARRRLLLGSTAAGLSGMAPVAVEAQQASDVAAASGAEVTSTKGKAVTILFDGKRCIHARYCVLGAPAVFLANVKGPWIKPDGDSVENVLHTIRQCPSGALTYRRHDGGPEEKPPPVNLVRMRENGPLAIHADMDLKGKGRLQRATLCRCGASKTKPYCDGAHKDVKFAASGEAQPGPDMKPLPRRDGVLRIEPLPDGPYSVSGNMEVVTGTGATIARLTQTILCRCGASKNKPFCDGSHVAAGFKAPA
ncbi:MAG: CDGSH iron-sulfur domain-containing protein [Burkholderiales bacterium]|nr:CDGSH iron-sulfur domain-containing protein [Burkholderiales bacterium]